MKGHIKQVQELLELWDEFNAQGLPDEEWEEFYRKRVMLDDGNKA